MRVATWAVLAALAATAAVTAWAAVRKVQIDARVHLLEAEGLYAEAARTGSSALRLDAGRACLRALHCYVPFDPAPRRAAALLLTIARSAAAGEVRAARGLVGEAVAWIDRSTLVFTPLAGERAEFGALLAERPDG